MTISVGFRTFQTADDLEKLVVHAASQYDKTGAADDFEGVEVTDGEYDELYKELRRHKPGSEAFSGASPSKASRA